jgi:hypothetical protein
MRELPRRDGLGPQVEGKDQVGRMRVGDEARVAELGGRKVAGMPGAEAVRMAVAEASQIACARTTALSGSCILTRLLSLSK